MGYIEKYEHLEDGKITYIDTIFESSSVLKTTYFTEKNKLYVHYTRGGTFSYLNVDKELHNAMLESESVGKYLAATIKKDPNKYPFFSEFTLSKNEIDEIKLLIEAKKKFINKDNINS